MNKKIISITLIIILSISFISISYSLPSSLIDPSIINPIIDKDKIIENPDGSFEFKTPDNDKVIVSYDTSPILKLEKWGKESYIQIDINFTNAEPDIFQDKIKIFDSDYEVLIYDLPVSNLFEYGGIEYEIILKNKPSKNYITMPIETKNLVYYYQPFIILKDDEYRDERFAGSYAFYHINKRNNEYKTGKAFHILRPVLIDALGDEIYADILIEKNIMKITMNQTWLNNAIYPVIIDPTFGKTDIGSVSYNPDPQRLRIQNTSLTESGTATKISIYFNLSTFAGAIKFAIYDNNVTTNLPQNLLATSTIIEHPLTAGVWENATINVFLSAGIYWVAFWPNSTWNNGKFNYDVKTNGTAFYGIVTWDGFPDPPTTFSFYSHLETSLFVTYTPVPETFYLTSLFHTGINNININGTLTSNLTETAINDTELALGVANAESGYEFFYWDNENVSHIHDITVTKTISINTTITAFALTVGGESLSVIPNNQNYFGFILLGVILSSLIAVGIGYAFSQKT